MLIELLRPDAAWENLLGREGVSFDIVGSEEPSADVALIAPSGIGPADEELARHHIRSGGSLIADVDAAALVFPELVGRPVRLRRLVSDQTFLFMNQGDIELTGYGRLIRRQPETTVWSCQPVLAPTGNGRGYCLLLPFNLGAMLSSYQRPVERIFPAEMPRLPFETVAAVDKGGVRRLVVNWLRAVAWARNEPYVHLSYCPPGLDPGFGFRVDVDDGVVSAMNGLAELARSRGMRFTWFVETGSTPNLKTIVKALTGQDVQLHCHMHRLFPDDSRNLANFERGREILKHAGVTPQAVAAPYGEWTPQLGRLFAYMRLDYSSEFCYAYDDLPGFPISDSGRESVLQVPVHPISLGRLVWARATTDQMIEYFRTVIDIQRARLEPCFLYDHPREMSRFGAVVGEVLDYGTQKCGGELNITDYAQWWRRRFNLLARVTTDQKSTVVDCSSETNEDMALTLEWPDRYATIVLRPGRYSHESLDYRVRYRSKILHRPAMGIVSSLLFRVRAARRRWCRRLRNSRLSL